MKEDPKSPDRRQLLRMTASITAASTLSSWGSYARAAQSSGSPALAPGSFTAEVDDIEVYCEVRGAGPLMIVQNGMWLDTFANHFALQLMDALAGQFTVLTFDARGQGRTTLGKGPITYGRFAADTVRLMDKLGIDDAHFIGHSDGGCIQLHLLLDFRDRVRTSTLVGTPYSHEAYSPKTKALFTEWFDQMVQGKDSNWFPETPQGAEPSTAPWWQELKKRYEAVSPHPEKFHDVRLQQRNCWAVEPNIGLREMARIDRPVLVIEAGKDEHIPREQFTILADSIPAAQRVFFAEMTHDIKPYIPDIAKAATAFIQKQ